MAADKADATQRFHLPSGALPSAGDALGELEQLPGLGVFPTSTSEEQYRALGDAVQAWLAALPSLRNAKKSAKEAVAARCLAAQGVTGWLAASDVVTAGDRFRESVERQYPGETWQAEAA